ncbi:gustatory receptor [Anopheles darlingi]|uniref:Gustatory receptor n=1 Tax=Anopheles darlingi TaxID=43151 RepID=W5JU65_ANODA|nr:gustatory receptor [Anopheles darlingi]
MNRSESKPAESTFCRILKPIYYVSKLAGLWPQSFTRSTPGVTVLDIVYVMAIYCVFGYCIIVNSSVKLWDYYMKPFESNILRYGLQTHLVNGLYLGVIIITTNVIQYKKKWEYMHLMDSVTQVVEQEFHVKNPVRVVQLFITTVMIAENIYLLWVLSGYYFLIDRTLNITTTYLYASYYLMNLSTLALINEYTYFVVHIRRLMTVVNRLLKQLLLNDAEGSDLILLDRGRKAKTPTIAYDEIFTVYGQAKKDFGMVGSDVKTPKPPKITMVAPTSAGFNKFSYTSVLNTYVTKLKIDNQSSMESILKTLNRLSTLHYHLAFNSGTWAFKIMAIANGSWILFYLLLMLTVITATTSTQTRGREAGDIVHQIIRKHQNHFSNDVIERLSTMSLQIKMRDMSFSCGLFKFDWQLFSSCGFCDDSRPGPIPFRTMAMLEGTLSKWTNVMKGWQYRWFVLDEYAGLLSYYTVSTPWH